MTENSTRPIITAGELTAGQYVILRGTSELLCHVDHVHPYQGRRSVMLLMTAVGSDAAPITRMWPAAATVTLATPEDLADAEVASRRQRLVAQLRELIDAIEDRELPVPKYRFNFGGVLDSYADLKLWAAYLGAEIQSGGSAGDIPVVKLDVGERGPVMDVHFQASGRATDLPVAEPEPTVDAHNDAADLDGEYATDLEQAAARMLDSLAGEPVTTSKEPHPAGGHRWTVAGQRGRVCFDQVGRHLALLPAGGEVDSMGREWAREVAEVAAAGDDAAVFALLAGHYGRHLPAAPEPEAAAALVDGITCRDR